jgi:hypothetical protein
VEEIEEEEGNNRMMIQGMWAHHDNGFGTNPEDWIEREIISW